MNSSWDGDAGFTKLGITSIVCETRSQEGLPRKFINDKSTPIQRSGFDPVIREEKKSEGEGIWKKRNTFFPAGGHANPAISAYQPMTTVTVASMEPLTPTKDDEESVWQPAQTATAIAPSSTARDPSQQLSTETLEDY